MVLLERHTAHETDYCVLEIDVYGNEGGERMYLAHLRVLRWSPSTLRKIIHDWRIFRAAVPITLYALPMLSANDPDHAKWDRFVRKLGWAPTGIMVSCNDELERQLYIHEKEANRRTAQE